MAATTDQVPPRPGRAWAWVSLGLLVATGAVALYGQWRVPPVVERRLPAPDPAPLAPDLAAQAAELQAFRATLRAQIAQGLAGVQRPVCAPGTTPDPAALDQLRGDLAPRIETWRRLPGLAAAPPGPGPAAATAAPGTTLPPVAAATLPPVAAAAPVATPVATATATATPGTARRTTAQLRDLLERVSVIVIGLGATEGVGTGTAFFIGPDLLVTNRHVLEGADPAQIFVTSRALGGVRQVTVVAQTDPGQPGSADFALMRLATGAGPGALRLSTATDKLTAVIAAGYPGLALANDTGFTRLMAGDLTAAPDLNMNSGEIRSTIGGAVTRLVHTADVLKGYSGGPLIDTCGRAVGVNTFIQIDQQQASKLNNAISAGDLTAFLTGQGVAAPVDPAPCDGPG